MSDDSDFSANPSRSDRFVDLENGHHSTESDSDSTTMSVDDEEEEDNAKSRDFDKTLPATHSYLGKLDNVGGYTLYDEGQVISMFAMHTSTLVFPGFTLPLVMRQFENEQLLEEMKGGSTFALICTDRETLNLCEYGVVMEVFEMSMSIGTINLKAKCRQRCKIVAGQNIRPMWGQMHKITVKILGEPIISSPVSNTQLQTLKASRTLFHDDPEHITKNYKYRRYHLSQFPYASWVYDHNELSFYTNLIIDDLARVYTKESLPQDPISLSYWFVQNFQLSHEERLEILRCPSVLERLRLELKYLKMERIIICGKCSIAIADQKNVFAMSKDGLQSNYCNPGGQVFETVTVTKAKNFKLSGEASRQFSWFPGYAWTIMHCRHCKQHLGWQFTSKNHHPRKFYGLANRYLDIRIFMNM